MEVFYFFFKTINQIKKGDFFVSKVEIIHFHIDVTDKYGFEKRERKLVGEVIDQKFEATIVKQSMFGTIRNHLAIPKSEFNEVKKSIFNNEDGFCVYVYSTLDEAEKNKEILLKEVMEGLKTYKKEKQQKLTASFKKIEQNIKEGIGSL